MIKIYSKNILIVAYSIFFISLFIYIPKIYIKNNIYYTSKEINKLYSQYSSLNEENSFLKKQLEEIKFKNQVLDSMIANPLFDDE